MVMVQYPTQTASSIFSQKFKLKPYNISAVNEFDLLHFHQKLPKQLYCKVRIIEDIGARTW